MRITRILGLCANLVWAIMQVATACAQVGPKLSVTRDPGAEDCPDADGLAADLARLGGGGEVTSAFSYSVAFSHTQEGLRASIRGSAGSARVLEDRGPRCRALAQATAITLALLRDSDARELDSSPTAPATETIVTQPPAPPPVPSEVHDEQEPSRGPEWIVSVGGAGLFGVVRPVAPAFTVEAGAAFARARVQLGALWMMPQTLPLAPGSLRETLVSGFVRPCLTTLRGALLRLDLCAGVHVGRIQTEARGYTDNRTASALWLTLPAELALAYTAQHYWLELGASALIRLKSTDFAVDGLGVAYSSPPIGALLSLRIAYASGR